MASMLSRSAALAECLVRKSAPRVSETCPNLTNFCKGVNCCTVKRESQNRALLVTFMVDPSR